MKTDKTLWICTIAFIVLTFIYTGIQHRKINRMQTENQLQALELSILNDSVTVYKSKTGELTYKLTSVEIEKGNLKKSLELIGIDKKILKERDIAWRQITAALRAELEAKGTGQTTLTDTFRIEKTDTIYYTRVNDWSNGNLSLFNSKIENSKLSFDYRYKTGIDFFTTNTRKKTTVSVILTDPNAEITTASSITVPHKKKWFERPAIWAIAGFGAGVLIVK